MWQHLLLTLRGQSLLFKILPISNTGVPAAYILATIHFFYPKLGFFSDMEYYFYQLVYRNWKFPNRFFGLNSNAVFSLFDCNWGKRNDPTACWYQLHPWYQVSQQGKCLSYPPDCMSGVIEFPNCVSGKGHSPPSNPH